MVSESLHANENSQFLFFFVYLPLAVFIAAQYEIALSENRLEFGLVVDLDFLV